MISNKPRNLLLVLACLALPFELLAQDAFVGTWILNSEKSRGPAGAQPSSATLTITSVGSGMFKSVSDTTVSGTSARAESTFALDGKDYAIVTTPALPGMPEIVQSTERVSGTVYKTSLKMGGKVVSTTLQELSADGKMLTLTTTPAGGAAAAPITVAFDRK
jgi:hypothetical protein